MLLRLSPFSDVTKFGEILEVFGNFLPILAKI